MTSLSEERDAAVDLARRAGELALGYQRVGVSAEAKADGEPVTAADRAANTLIVEALADRFPDDAILAEESDPDPRRFETRRTWMVDPIDGTSEFIRGSDAWEVLIGLVENGVPVLGVVYNPRNDVLIEAESGRKAWITEAGGERRSFTVRAATRPYTLAVKEGHYDGIVREVARRLGVGDVVEKAGFGARIVLAARSEVDLVLRVGGTPREWDTCALEVVLEEAGAGMRSWRGRRFSYLEPDPTQRDGMIVAGHAILDEVLAVAVPAYERHLGSG